MSKEIAIVSLLIIAASTRGAAAFSSAANQITSLRAAAGSGRFIIDSSSVLCESFNDDDDDEYEPQEKKKGFFANFFEELDAFVDDATSRRLGNGAQYYGKRKSSFYGKDDANRKKDKAVSDPLEDYRGPSNAGYFKWMPDAETGELKPVTRLREVNIEKKSRF